MAFTNHQVRLAARPTGLPTPQAWECTEETLDDPAPGRFVVRISHLSLDPAMRGWMSSARSYLPPVGIGEVMRAVAVGRVVASAHEGFAVGEHVTGMFGVQEYPSPDGGGVQKVDPAAAPLPTYLGVLGMTGLTAYFGMLDVRAMQESETVLVSGAAGAVGSVVGQLAKIKGGRAVVCGAISQYNAEGRPVGPANYMSLLVNRARMEGFLVFDYADRYPGAIAELAGWLREGKLKSREDVVHGTVDDFPDTLLRLFRSDNTGKLVLQINDEE